MILFAFSVWMAALPVQAQSAHTKTETVKVYGNCSMCKATIEKAAYAKKTAKAEWNEQTKLATITFDSRSTTLNAILKKIGLAGYDNQQFLAPDAAYNKLPACCRYERVLKKTALATPPVSTSPSHDGHQHGGIKDTAQLAAVLDQYFSLKDALVGTNANAASAKAKAMLTAVDAVKMDQLSAETHLVWMKVLNELKEDAGRIGQSADIAVQRQHFMRLSVNMYRLLKADKPAGTVYYQFCPMANDGKGANWLSRESAIRNPYYGATMLSCGRTAETLNQ